MTTLRLSDLSPEDISTSPPTAGMRLSDFNPADVSTEAPEPQQQAPVPEKEPEPQPISLSDVDAKDVSATPPLTEEDRGVWHALKSGSMSGLHSIAESARQSVELASGEKPTMGAAAPPEEAALAAPLQMAMPDKNTPARVAYHLAEGMTGALPEMAGGMAGAAGGGAVAGPVGAMAGAGLGAGAVYAFRQVAPTFAAELHATPDDPDGAWSRALKKTAIGAAGTAAAFAAFGINPFEGEFKNLAFQAFGLQPAVAMTQRGVTNAAEGKPVTEGMEGTYLESALGTVAPYAAMRPFHGKGGKADLELEMGEDGKVRTKDGKEYTPPPPPDDDGSSGGFASPVPDFIKGAKPEPDVSISGPSNEGGKINMPPDDGGPGAGGSFKLDPKAYGMDLEGVPAERAAPVIKAATATETAAADLRRMMADPEVVPPEVAAAHPLPEYLHEIKDESLENPAQLGAQDRDQPAPPGGRPVARGEPGVVGETGDGRGPAAIPAEVPVEGGAGSTPRAAAEQARGRQPQESVPQDAGVAEAPVAKPKAVKKPDYVTRLENYFQPGRVVPSYYGQDRVVGFDRGQKPGDWSVKVQEIDNAGQPIGNPRDHMTSPKKAELEAWEKTNPPPIPKPKAEAMSAPQSLMQYLAKVGLKTGDPALNDIRNADFIASWHRGKTGQKKIIRPDGLTVNQAVQRAEQQGFIPQGERSADDTKAYTAQDLNRFSDAIDQESKGNPVHRESDIGQGQEAAANKDFVEHYRDDLERHAAEFEIDPNGLSDKDLMRSIDERRAFDDEADAWQVAEEEAVAQDLEGPDNAAHGQAGEQTEALPGFEDASPRRGGGQEQAPARPEIGAKSGEVGREVPQDGGRAQGEDDARESVERPSPKTESVQTVDGKRDQFTLDGTDRSAKQAAEARPDRMKGAKPQKGADEGGLFGEGYKQRSMFSEGEADRAPAGWDKVETDVGVSPEETTAALKSMRDALDQAGLKDVSAAIVKFFDRPAVQGRYRIADKALELAEWVALGGRRAHVLGHEMMHAIKNLGLLRDHEWKALETAAEKVWMDKYKIGERYPKLPYPRQLDEAISEGFGAYYAKRGVGPKTAIGRILQRAIDGLKAIHEWATGKEAEPYMKVFDAVHRGDVGRRTPEKTEGGVFSREPRVGERESIVEPKFTNRREAQDWARQNLRGSHHNDEQGWDIAVDGGGIRSATADARSQRDLDLLQAVPDVLKNGKLTRSEAPREPEQGVSAYHTLEHTVRYDGKDYRVRATVREQGNGQRFYDQHSAEIKEPQRPERGVAGEEPVERSTGSAGAQDNIGVDEAETNTLEARDSKGPAGLEDRRNGSKAEKNETEVEPSRGPVGRTMDKITAGIKAIVDNHAPGLMDVAADIRMSLNPMSAGSDTARATAKDFANAVRQSRWEWNRVDRLIAETFTPEQQKRMWEAADEQSVLEQQGKRTKGKGIDRLAPDERAAVEGLQKTAKQTFDIARKLGMIEGEGLPSYVPRMIVDMNTGKAVKSVNRENGNALDSIGGNFRTSSSQLLNRKHLKVEETEAAAKAKFGESAEVLRNIRTLAMATAKLQDAIAGRVLVDKIKQTGRQTGAATVADAIPPGTTHKWFTIDTPALRTWRPKMKDGKPALDADGEMIFEKVPVYVRGDFEGPLRAVLTGKDGMVYRALMNLKARAMSVIMYSPLIHNGVEWGRALAAMPGKVATFKVYFEGNAAKKDPVQMRQAIEAGLVPIGARYGFQDLSSIMEEPSMAPGRSWTAQLLAAVPGLFDKDAGVAVKRAVDKAGDIWHNTLLWDRVADLQMGLYTNFRDNLIAKGSDPTTAQRLAAHLANRYAGAVPIESMSHASRKIGNLMLFSRSFTLGNIGAMKDALVGTPSDVKAQILRDAGKLPGEAADKYVRRKSQAVVAIDIALNYAMNAAFSSAIAVLLLNTSAKDEAFGYLKRLHGLLDRAKENPLDLINPMEDILALTPGADNEPGKEGRIYIGRAADGTATYMRLPMGKIGEEFEGWLTRPLEMLKAKGSTFARPVFETLANDKGFGRKVYDPYDNLPGASLRRIGDIVTNFLGEQVPMSAIEGIGRLVTGDGDARVNAAQVAGPLVGVTFSKGAKGGPEMGEYYAAKTEHDFQVQKAMPEIRSLIRTGKRSEAIEKMTELDIPPKTQASYMRSTLHPRSAPSPQQLAAMRRYASPEQMDRMQMAVRRSADERSNRQ